MNYERLTVDRFELNLKEGKYAGLTGARRAIGKADWTAKDRARGQEIANKFFGEGGKAAVAKTKAPKAAKPAAKPKKAAKPAQTKAPRKVAQAAPPPAKRAPSEMSPQLPLAGVVRVGNLDDTRFSGAAAVVSSYANRGSLSPSEQRTYELAQAEFELLVQPAAKAAAKRQPVTSAPEAQGDGSPAVQQNERVAAPKLTIPKVDLSAMTAEQREQHERLVAAAKALPTTLGQQA